jgi:xylulose-5-phosphate/fructose-6-phosphate phosphoketolase
LLIHQLTYRRHGHDNFHVRGYKEEGTTTTPFDMVVLNNLDRFQLAFDAVRRIARFSHLVPEASQRYSEQMQRHKIYVSEHGEDMPEVRNWKWSS